mgnify:CR=1 FL=1
MAHTDNSFGSSPAQHELTLIVRRECHLCDDMRATLGELLHGRAVRVTELDVDADPVLLARYNEWVPVLKLGEHEICHYFIDAVALEQALGSGV